VTTIHRAQIEDIPSIKAVLAVTWRDTYSSFVSESSIAEVTAEWHSPKVLEAEIRDSSSFFGIAKSSSNEIVGMITAHLHDELLLMRAYTCFPSFNARVLEKGL
jgi:hypothetical protein